MRSPCLFYDRIMNHLIFVAHSFVISCALLVFAQLGLAALTSFISLLFVLTNIFVIKQIEILDYGVTSADAYIIGVSFGINLIQEIWGKQAAQKTIFISFASCFFYLVMGYFQIWYIAAAYDTSHQHFVFLMNHSLRIMIASLISYLIVQYFDTIMYGYLQKKSEGNYFIARNYVSMFSSQLFDTLIFSFLGLYGIVHNIFHIIIVSYGIKIAAILLTTPCMYVAKKFVQK